MKPYKKTTLRQKRQKLHRLILSASFRAGLVVFILVFGFLFIWQTNSVSTKGYSMSDLEGQVKVLEQENRKLEVKIAENTSMQNIQNRITNSGLVVVDKIEYMSMVGSVVVQR